MKLVCYIGNQKYRIVQGSTFSDEFNETLDSGTIVIRTDERISSDIIKPFRDVFIMDEDTITEWNGYTKGQKFDGFFKHFLISDPKEEDLTLRDEGYRYTIDLFSETKGLEIISLPNSSLTQPLYLAQKRSVWKCLNEIVEMYSPKLKVAKKGVDGTYSDIGEWEYQNKYVLDPGLEQIFDNIYAPDFTLNAPTLRDIISKLMIVKDMIPVVYNDMITCMDISTTHGTFMKKGIATIVSSRSSNDYVDNLRTNYSNALSQEYTCRRTEKLGFRNDSTPLMTLQNMRVETGYPIYKINKVLLCYYKQGTLMCTSKGKWYTGDDADKKVVFLCKQDITKLVKLNQERDVLSQQWNEVVDGQPTTIDDLAKYKLCTVGYSIGSKYITGWGEETTYPKGFLLIETGTSTPIQVISSFMNIKYPYGIYTADYVVSQRLKEWGLTDEDIQSGGDFYLKFTNAIANDGVFYDPTNNNEKVTSIGVRSKMFFFEIEYEAYYNGAVIHSKSNSDDLVTINDNTSSSLTLLESHGIYQREKIDRYGNPYLVIPARYEDISELQELGTILDDGNIIFSRQFSIFETCVLASYKATQNYVLKNYFNTVWAKHRTYNLMTYDESISRAENRKAILYLSTQKSYWENSDNVQLPLSQDIYDNQTLVSFIKPSEIISYGDFASPNLINFGYLTFNVKKTPVNFGMNYETIKSPFESLYATLYIASNDGAYTIYSDATSRSYIRNGATVTITNVSKNFLDFIWMTLLSDEGYDKVFQVLKNDDLILFGMPKTEYDDYITLIKGDKSFVAKCGEALHIKAEELLDKSIRNAPVEIRISLSAKEDETRYIDELVIRPQLMDLSRTTSGEFVSYDSVTNELELEFKYMSDINCFVSGNSMCFNIAMNDNVTMGNYIKDLVPNADYTFTHESDIEKDGTENRVGALLDYDLIVDDIKTGYCENIGFYVSHKEDKRNVSYVLGDIEKRAKISSFYQTLFSAPKIMDSQYEEIGSYEEIRKIGKKYKINKDNKERIDMTFQLEMQKDNKNILFSTWVSKLNDLMQTTYKKIEQQVEMLANSTDINIYYTSYYQYDSSESSFYENMPIMLIEVARDLYDYELVGTSLDLTHYLDETQNRIFTFVYECTTDEQSDVVKYEFIPDTAYYESERIVLIGKQFITDYSGNEETTNCMIALYKTDELATINNKGIQLTNTALNYYFSNVEIIETGSNVLLYAVKIKEEELKYNGINYDGFYRSTSPKQTTLLKHGTKSTKLDKFPYSGIGKTGDEQYVRGTDYKVMYYDEYSLVFLTNNYYFFSNNYLRQKVYTSNYSYLYPQTMYIATSNEPMKEELVYREYSLNDIQTSDLNVSDVLSTKHYPDGNAIMIDLDAWEGKILLQTKYTGGYNIETKLYVYTGHLYNPYTQQEIQAISGYKFITNADEFSFDEETNMWTATYKEKKKIYIFYTGIVSIQYWYRYIPNFNELSWLIETIGNEKKYVSQETRQAVENASMKFVFGVNLTIEDLMYCFSEGYLQATNYAIYYSLLQNRDFRIFDDKANVIGEEMNCFEAENEEGIPYFGKGQFYKKK